MEVLYRVDGVTARGVPHRPRVSRVPSGLSRGDRIWFTTGKGETTTGYFVLAKAPELVAERPTISGGYSHTARSFLLSAQLRVGGATTLPIGLAPGAQRLWSTGSFAHVMSDDAAVTIMSNRHDGGKRRTMSWTPWAGANDPRLVDLRRRVETGDRAAVDGWFRRQVCVPPPAFRTVNGLSAVEPTELDHLIPVRILRNRLLSGKLPVDDVPSVLVMVECTRFEHPIEDPRIPNSTVEALHRCPVKHMVTMALLRYYTPLVDVSTGRRVPAARLKQARELWFRWSR